MCTLRPQLHLPRMHTFNAKKTKRLTLTSTTSQMVILAYCWVVPIK